MCNNNRTHHPLAMGITKIKRYMAHTTKRIVKLSLLSLESQSSESGIHICHQFLYKIRLTFFVANL